MALTKIKLDEVDTKATPVLADSVLLSDSEDDGRGKLVTGTAFEEMIATGDTLTTALGLKQNASNAVTTDTDQVITGVKTYNNIAPLRFDRLSGGYYAFQFFFESALQWRWYQTGSNIAVQHRDIAGNYTDVMSFHYQNKRVQFNTAPTVPTATSSDNSTLAANTAFVQAQKVDTALTGTPTVPTAAPGTNTQQIANCAFVQAATASAIYDLPVTRSGLVSAGTDVVLFETGVLDPAWYDTTHILNVSFFARNTSGVADNTTFKVQLYDDGTSTAHTIASITADTLDYRLLQASIYRASSQNVHCHIQYGVASNGGYVSLTAGAYKLRVVCASTLSTIFGAAQVRFTK